MNDAAGLLDQLTLEEQVSLLAGADFWRTVAVPRLGIPPLKVTDGPAGARGGGALVGGRRTAAFPVGIALGSTWDAPLLREVGEHLAREALDKGAGALLGPTVNLMRSSLNGRNFECFSEDPQLSGELAAAYIQGLQSRGVAATVKHFAGNESEYQRGTIDSLIPERALRELYLRPFEHAVRAGGTWAVMSAYNRLNGTYCSENRPLLTGILRREWGFDGLVMSDWGGTHSAGESLRAGLDLEMPGPARARADLLAEVQGDGATQQAARVAAGNVLRLLERTGTLAHPRDVRDEHERAQDYPDTRALIRRAGAAGTVLLKNAGGLLPLPAGVRVAVVGPNAAVGQVMGGGSAQLNAHRRVSPLEGLRAALGEANVTHAEGARNHRFVPALDVPVEVQYLDADGHPLAREERQGSEVMWFGLPDGVPQDFRARLTLDVQAPQAGRYELGLFSAGRARLALDGAPVLDNHTDWAAGSTYFGFGSDERRAELELGAGAHTVTIDFEPLPPTDNGLSIAAFSAVRFGFGPTPPAGMVTEAARVAADTDYAVVCVGTNGEWETEGVDRQGLTLPGEQDELVRAVAAANPNTVVLLQTGGPVLMPWLDRVPAVLQAWFPGQEAGHAAADVLLGRADPGGRLPQTFPARLEDDPTHPESPDAQYPGEEGRVEYREGLYTGYRHTDQAGLTPLFPFGFGLSYATFELGEVQVAAATFGPGEAVTAEVDVTNTGGRGGETVVQLYVRDPQTTLERPDKELKAFAKVALEPGQTRRVRLALDMRAFAYYDGARRAWVADAGEFELLVGQSSADLPRRTTVRLEREWLEPVTG